MIFAKYLSCNCNFETACQEVGFIISYRIKTHLKPKSINNCTTLQHILIKTIFPVD